MSEREQFEVWWCEHIFTPPHGGSLREYAYATWQASRRAALEEAIEIVETYQVSVGNSAAGEIACEMTMSNLGEIRDAIRALSHAKEE